MRLLVLVPLVLTGCSWFTSTKKSAEVERPSAAPAKMVEIEEMDDDQDLPQDEGDGEVVDTATP